MKTARILRKLLYPAGFYTTVLSMLILLIAGTKFSLPFRYLLCFFCFGLTLAAADLLWGKNSLSLLLQSAIHTGIALLGFVVFVLLCTGYASQNGGMKALLAAIVYLVLHTLYCVARGIILHTRVRKASEEKEYTPKFQGKSEGQ